MYGVKHIVLLVCTAMIASCTAGRKAESAGIENVPKAYEDTIYCFNGRSIVHLNGLAGCIADDGREIIPPVWDSLDFLSNDVLMLYRSGLAVLATRDGRLFSETASPANLEKEFEERFSRMQVADILYWDGVLDRLDSLCNECLALPESATIRNAAILSQVNEIKQLLQTPQGYMAPAQLARLSEIEDKFLSLRR